MKQLGVDEGPIERHSARVFFIMERLATQASIRIDHEVTACAALLHDIGLYEPAASPHFYLRHGRDCAQEIIEAFSWSDKRTRRCLRAIELHHRLRPQWNVAAEVELLRLADLVDASRGVVSLGLDQAGCARFPGDRATRAPARLLRHSLRGGACMTRGTIGILLNARRRRVHR